MHRSLLVPLLTGILFVRCDEPVDDSNFNPPNTIASNDTSSNDDTIPASYSLPADSVLNGKEISYYLALPSVSAEIKALYRSRNHIASVAEIALVMDSIFSKDTAVQPFYFLVASELMQNTDGAPSETAGMSAKHYVETNSAQFIRLLTYEPLLGDTCLSTWVKSVAGEIKISAEGQETAEVAAVKNKMVKNCIGASSEEVQKLNVFIERLLLHVQQ